MRNNKAVLAEQNRHSVATETETHRSNLQNEAISRGTLTETIRSHKANEFENNRSNVARERENYRHNLATETETHANNLRTDATNRYISDTGNQTRLQTAQIGADTQRYVADTNAQVTREGYTNQQQIAQLQSDTSRYIAEMNNQVSRDIANLNAMTSRLNTQNSNSARLQQTALQTASNQLIAERNRAQQYVQNRNLNALEQQRIDIQQQIANVNQEVNLGQLTNSQAQTKVRGLEAILNNVVKFIGILAGR